MDRVNRLKWEIDGLLIKEGKYVEANVKGIVVT